MDSADLSERLRSHVTTLASAPRPPQTREHELAREYILAHLRKAGFNAEVAERRTAEYVCLNVLTRPEPEDDRLPLVIIGAHYDSGVETPGADDNASAVAALLELAAWIRPHLSRGGQRARLQLVSYDLEEYGMIGSYLHAEALHKSRTRVLGMASLEMLGYTDKQPGGQKLPAHLASLYPDVGDFIGVCANDNSLSLLQTVVEAMKTVAGLPVECLAVPGNGEAIREVRLSDHSPFWDHGFPALMVTDTSFFRNPHYHQETDLPDTLDYPFLAKVTEGVCRATLRLLTI